MSALAIVGDISMLKQPVSSGNKDAAQGGNDCSVSYSYPFQRREYSGESDQAPVSVLAGLGSQFASPTTKTIRSPARRPSEPTDNADPVPHFRPVTTHYD